MFSTQHPRSTSRHRAVAGGLVAVATAAALTLLVPGTASAAESGESYAEGQFLGGTLLGGDLGGVVEATGAFASNNGTQPTQTQKDPLQVTALQAATVGTGESVQLSLGDVVQAGAVTQYAQAKSDGTSTGASGAVSNNGGIGVGADSSAPLGTTTVDLEALLGSEFASAIADLKLELDAVAAQATATLDGAQGDYNISGARLVIASPAVSGLTDKVDSALDEVLNSLNGLSTSDGQLVGVLDGLLRGVDPSLGLLGGNADVSVSIDASGVKDAVHRLLQDSYGDSAVSFDLDAGTIIVDLEKLVGSLNGLPANTELLDSDVLLPVLHEITDTVSTLSDQIIDAVELALHDATVRIAADVNLDVAQAPIVKNVCELVTEVVQVPTEVTEQVNLGGLLGWVTQTVTKLVDQTVTKTVCHDEVIPVAPLKTSVDLDIVATIDDLLNGAAAQATLNGKLLGIPLNLNADLDVVLDDLGAVLNNTLFDSDGTVAELTQTLQTTLVDPALTGVLNGDGSMALALTDVLSVKVNVQEVGPYTPPGASPSIGSLGGALGDLGTARSATSLTGFTETAVRVSALGGVGSGLATIDLASATVAAAGVGGDGGDCTGAGCGGDPGCVVDCGTGGDGGGGNYAATGSLAYTGVGISILIAILLALMAAGAYMVRESYRNRQAASRSDR